MVHASSFTADCGGFWRPLLEIPCHWVGRVSRVNMLAEALGGGGGQEIGLKYKSGDTDIKLTRIYKKGMCHSVFYIVTLLDL